MKRVAVTDVPGASDSGKLRKKGVSFNGSGNVNSSALRKAAAGPVLVTVPEKAIVRSGCVDSSDDTKSNVTAPPCADAAKAAASARPSIFVFILFLRIRQGMVTRALPPNVPPV